MAATPRLSIVVPAYNAAGHLVTRIEYLKRTLAGLGVSHELLLVDDGSTDETAAMIRRLADQRTEGIVLPKNLGKFVASKAGMARSRGQCCLFMDADVPYELDAVPPMADLVIDRGFHVVVGDRTLPQSAYSQSLGPVRRAATQTFTHVVRLLVT